MSARQSRYSGRLKAATIAPYVLSVVALVILSCSGDRASCPQLCPVPTGRAVLDASVRLDHEGHPYSEAFSFSTGRVVRLPNKEGIEPDLMVSFIMNRKGELYGLELGHQQMNAFLYHIGTGDTPQDSQVIFARTRCIPEGMEPWFFWAATVWPNDVWAVLTHDGKFAKITIVDVFFVSQSYDSAGVTITRNYGEVTFDWQYQPDGTRCFE